MTSGVKRPRGSVERSRGWRLRIVSNGVLLRASSLRCAVFSQPFCTNVSCPSGRSPETAPSRSPFPPPALIDADPAPAPMTTVFAASGSVCQLSAVPAGLGSQRYAGVAPHSPPGPVLPVKLVAGRADGSSLNVPSGPRSQLCATPRGNDGNDCSNPGTGAPGAAPAPLSNRIRTDGSASKAASAASKEGCAWIGSSGSVTFGTPIEVWKTTGARFLRSGESNGARFATYSDRKSNQRVNVAGSSESMWVPLVNVNHLRAVPVKRDASAGQCPPVCSSVHWQARNTGTSILFTNVTGASGSATDGTYVLFLRALAIRSTASACSTWLALQSLSPPLIRASAHACPPRVDAGLASCARSLPHDSAKPVFKMPPGYSVV